jgi:hypothetical protein
MPCHPDRVRRNYTVPSLAEMSLDERLRWRYATVLASLRSRYDEGVRDIIVTGDEFRTYAEGCQATTTIRRVSSQLPLRWLYFKDAKVRPMQ